MAVTIMNDTENTSQYFIGKQQNTVRSHKLNEKSIQEVESLSSSA